MSYCEKCGAEIDNSVYCLSCGHQKRVRTDKHKESVSIGYYLLGAALPLVGVTLWISLNNRSPQKARASLIGVIISLPIWFFLIFIFAFAIPSIGHMISNT